MAYSAELPVTTLEFSDGFNYYGNTTSLIASATVNLSVPSARHDGTGEILTDGAVIPAQDVTAFAVPRVERRGWRAPDGSVLDGWSYDLALTITAAGQPTLLWAMTISPRGSQEIITPSMGTITAIRTASVSPDPDVAGAYLIGE